ncbi:MAG: lasso peptide biosynthesis B2 protein [Candidatus Neomarinimicrobiota bacterium]
MKRLRKFLGLPVFDQAILISSALLILVIRLGLLLLSFGNMCHLLVRLQRIRTRPSGVQIKSAGQRIVWSLEMVGRFMLGTRNCLAQAMAARVLLEWWGKPGHVCIGVARGGDGELKAHAWVEGDDAVIMGGTDVSGYTPLLVLEGEIR